MVCDENSRIGNPSTKGVQFYRGSSNSVTYNETKPANVTNVGGSTILIAAETIENFSCAMIAKYRTASSTAGQGICRCYIASETKLRNDEGLYAYDCISNPSRIKRMNIKNFGNSSFGDVAGTNIQLNNYATITAVNGRKVTYKNQTTNADCKSPTFTCNAENRIITCVAPVGMKIIASYDKLDEVISWIEVGWSRRRTTASTNFYTRKRTA